VFCSVVMPTHANSKLRLDRHCWQAGTKLESMYFPEPRFRRDDGGVSF
jgi:hypothetical protein